MHIFCVIATHNASSWVEQCISSLSASTCSLSIIVVDNNSSDDTLERVRRFQDVICFPQSRNLGFGQANNIGIRHALHKGADFVFLLNQDAYIQRETISFLIAEAIKDPSIGLLTPLHLDGHGTQIDPNFSRYIAEGASSFYSDLYLGVLKESYQMSARPNAAAWLLTRDCLLQVGGFDPLFFMYGEDDDLFERIRYHGFKVIFVPQAVIYHYRGKAKAVKSRWIKQKINSSLYAIRFSVSANLRILKALKPFQLQITEWLFDSLKDIAKTCISLHLTYAILQIVAFFWTFALLPIIWLHRRSSRIKGEHWLD